jgi:histidinol-phosphate phosphatase family domain/HAD-superfamily hydrolase, subfamily IIIA
MIKEAIILAGGLGTRLREAVPDLPKCMANINGRPFLSYVIDYYRMQGVQYFVFSLGYKHEIIESYLNSEYPSLDYEVAIENDPLGTGGAIQLALQQTTTENILILNGDTLFKVNITGLNDVHIKKSSECTLALKPMVQFDRYGVVELNKDLRVISFKEKQHYESGNINGGVYILNKQAYLKHQLAQKHSFEKDYLEAYVSQSPTYGCIQDGYFVDIGIPDDYVKAQSDLKKPSIDQYKIDSTWTLFLDRDGVINDEKLNEYVLNWDQFIFSKGVLDAFKILTPLFSRIIIVSNQRGVSKQLMSEEDLLNIHKEMEKEVINVGGRIDKIYYCTDKNDHCFNRKPNPGMAIQAKNDFPSIDFTKSIMVGNKLSDMRFGRNAGMYTVFLTTTNPETPFPHPYIDAQYAGLLEFALSLKS